ncbi:MAG: 4-amino-4-deoxy-L-arabinose transferase, partial [Cyanobium sp.]
ALCFTSTAELRVDYTLDLALAATTTLALWLLGRWQRSSLDGGGRWFTAVAAALAIGAAVLVKQSALLVLTLPSLWCVLRSFSRPKRMLQTGVALAVVIGMALPWLHHTWITTLGGTNRAVVVSAAQEGDPPLLSLSSLLWYPRLWPGQLGLALLLPALAGAGLALWRRRAQRAFGLGQAWERLSPGWSWLIGCAAACLVCTTLSPNKDGRYIAPLLPLLALLLARGWWQLGLELQPRLGARGSAALLAAGLLGGGGALLRERELSLQRQTPAPAAAAMAELRRQVGTAPVTLLTVP